MDLLSKRQKDILLYLAKTEKNITSNWIAKELEVSSRTIRNDIKVMQQISESAGFTIESIRGEGFTLNIVNQALFSSLLKQVKGEYDDVSGDFSEQKGRVLYMLERFLLENSPIKMECFTDEIYVSMSTIQNDIKIVKDILEKHDLKLTNRPHYGSKVEGDEYMKRLCLSHALISRNQDAFLGQDTLQLINQELFEKTKEIIIKKVNQYKIDISDISLENLATHIAIACKRIERGFLIEQFADSLIDKYPFEQIVAKEIIEEVEIFTGLIFTNTETEYIIVHLLGTKLLHKKELVEFSEFDEVGTIVQCMLKRLKEEVNWDFSDDNEFIQALTLHIRPAMNRLRHNMNIRNPLLNDIKKKHPIAFEGAVITSHCIKDYLKVEIIEDEIAYIALHIGVALERKKSNKKKKKKILIVCASGVGSAKLLYYRIQNLFEQEIEVVDTINYYNLKKYELSSIDLIISTIPISEYLGVPITVVNTFLEEKDVDSIKKIITSNQNEIRTYLQPSMVFLQQDLPDKESVITFLCDQLYKKKLVQKDYVKFVLERELVSPTSFGNLVAIPHPITPVTEQTFWEVCILKRQIEWHDKQMVQFVCLLNVKKSSQGDLEYMFKKLISIIEDKVTVQKLIASNTAEELIKIMES